MVYLAAVTDNELRHAIAAFTVVIVVIFVAGFAVLWLRKRLRKELDGSRPQAFEIEQVNDMLRNGEISPEEYRRLKRLALGLGLKSSAKDDSQLTEGRKLDEEDKDKPQ
jgi:hypothetical protein